MRGQAVGALALVAAVGLGAAGCGEDSPKPGPVKDSLNSAPAVSPEDFTRAFIKTLNTGSTSLDTSKWRPMFAPECVYCERIADQLDSIKTNGGTFRADPWTIDSVRIADTSTKTATTISVVQIPPQEIRYKKGGRLQTTAGESSAVQKLSLRRQGDSWVATSFGEES